MDVIITGYAGFIGYHLTQKNTPRYFGKNIIAIDNLNNYYDTTLKKSGLKKLNKIKNSNKLKILNVDINNYNKIFAVAKKF